MISPVIQPQSYWQLIKRSLTFYKICFFQVYFLSLITALIYFVPRLFTLFLMEDFFYDLSYFNPIRLWILLIDICGFFFFMALLWRMVCCTREAHEKVSEDFSFVFKKLPTIFASILIQIGFFLFITLSIVVFYRLFLKKELMIVTPAEFQGTFWLGAILLLHMVIGIYILFLFIFYMPLILIENKGIFAALKKSAILVWGNWWRTFWILITPSLCYFFALVFIKYLLNFEVRVYFTGPLVHFSWLAILLQIFLFSLVLPWIAAVLLVQLRDLEVRKKV